VAAFCSWGEHIDHICQSIVLIDDGASYQTAACTVLYSKCVQVSVEGSRSRCPLTIVPSPTRRSKILLQIAHAHTSSVSLRKKFEPDIHMNPHIVCWNLRTQTRMPVDDSANTSAHRLVMIGAMSCDRAPVTVSYPALGEPLVRSRQVSVRMVANGCGPWTGYTLARSYPCSARTRALALFSD
jgi:hypothetical protein